MIIGVIYKIQNKINNKIYIGQTIQKTPKNRFNQHIRESKYNNNNIFLYNSIKKYGKENFKFTIIDTAITKEELNKKEINYIKYFNTLNEKYGYNIRNGGQNNTYTPELGKRISLGKIKSNTKNGVPKVVHPKTKYIDFEIFESLIKQNPKINSKQLANHFNIELNTFLKKIRRHYNLKLIEIRSKILNIEINEAKLTYKKFDIYEFLTLIKNGYKYYEIGYHFKQDLGTLKRKWKRWYPNKTFQDLQKNIDILLENYLKFGKPNGNFI